MLAGHRGDPRTGESPYASWPAYDIVAQAMSGHAHITGADDGAGGYPSGVSVGDIYPGTLMALGVLSAILNARETGKGQFFHVAMYDAMLAFCETVVVNYGYEQANLGPRGQHHPNLMPFGIYPASDGGIALACPGANPDVGHSAGTVLSNTSLIRMRRQLSCFCWPRQAMSAR